MTSDATLRPHRPPRGLILSTGEDVPRGQSLVARLLTVEVAHGDVDVARLTECQDVAARGAYAAALAAFVQWVAIHDAEIRTGRDVAVSTLRAAAATSRSRQRAQRGPDRSPRR